MSAPTPEEIDQLLPQTQCGLCGHGGCMPYAEALVYENAAINLCPPGGLPVLHLLGNQLGKDSTPYENEMREKAKPKFIAVIREDECIGCTKCIKACPVDAILGSAKSMHTIITDECTGCELCVPPCPVDCIDMIEIAPQPLSIDDINQARKDQYRKRFIAREQRLLSENKEKQSKQEAKTALARKDYVAQALLRNRSKKA